MTTLIHRQRQHKLTDAMLTGLDLLIHRGSAMRVRAGWGFGSIDSPIIAPATMDALWERGLVQRRHSGFEVTTAGRKAHAAITGVAA